MEVIINTFKERWRVSQGCNKHSVWMENFHVLLVVESGVHSKKVRLPCYGKQLLPHDTRLQEKYEEINFLSFSCFVCAWE